MRWGSIPGVVAAQKAALACRVVGQRLRPIPVVRFAGSDREVGREHGSRFRREIRRWLRSLDREGLLGLFKTRPVAPALCAAVRKADAGLAEEIAGIAEGAAVAEEAIWALNLYPSLSLEARLGCTAVTWNSNHGRTLLGKNADLGLVPPPSFIRAARASEALPLVVHTFCGTVWGTAGLNGAGIAIAGSSVNALPAAGGEDGVPAVFVQTLALRRAPTLRDAIALVRDVVVFPPEDGFALLLVDAYGEAAVVERAGGAGAVVGPTRSFLSTTNTFVSNAMAPLVDRRSEASRFTAEGSASRGARLRRLWADGTGARLSLTTVLADHAESPDRVGAICRHQGMFRLRDGGFTSFAFVLDPVARVLHAARGPACGGRFQAVPLATPEDTAAVARDQEGIACR